MKNAYKAAIARMLKNIQDENMKQAVEDGYDLAALTKPSRYGSRSGGKFNTQVLAKDEDGKTVTAEIADVLNNAEKVKLSTGQIVDVDSLEWIDLDTKDVLDRMKSLGVEDAASTFWQSFQKNAGERTSVENYKYVLGWITAYQQGKTHAGQNQ